MNLIDVLIQGTVIGVIHFVVLGALYANPFIDRYYKRYQQESPAVKAWENQKEYLLKMFLGTQVEVYILTAAYLYLRQFLNTEPFTGALILGGFFAGIRVYPRFWNMWIQSTYPNTLLLIEFVNGVIGTFLITIGLSFF